MHILKVLKFHMTKCLPPEPHQFAVCVAAPQTFQGAFSADPHASPV